MELSHCEHCSDHEARISAIETAVGVLRWLLPILVTGASVIVALAK